MRTTAAVLVALVGAGSVVSAQNQAALNDPDPADWLHWRRTADAWGYSPLDRIDTANVDTLELAWAWALEEGRSQPTQRSSVSLTRARTSLSP